MKVDSQSPESSRFGDFFDALEAASVDIRVAGFVNVEGGKLAVATKMFQHCDCQTLGPATACEDCGRAAGNFCSLPSGDGDGVYALARLVDSSTNRVVGAFVVFDYQYQIANFVRSMIEAQKVPNYPVRLAGVFEATYAVPLAQLDKTETLYFADAGWGIDSEDAMVDLDVPPGATWEVFTFVEPVSTEPATWAQRLSTTQGMDAGELTATLAGAQEAGKAIFSTLGLAGEFTLPSVIPRALLVVDSELVKSLSIRANPLAEDWETLSAKFMAAAVTSHQAPMNVSTVWMNALLAIEIDRAAGGDISDSEAKRLLFDVWTWAFQGAVLGDKDCEELIARNRYQPSAEEIAALLRRRGLEEASREAIAGTLFRGPGNVRVQKLQESAESADVCSNCGYIVQVGSSYCANCGEKIQSLTHCPQCGKQHTTNARFCSACGQKLQYSEG